MKKILLTSLILVFFSQLSFASPDPAKFAIIRLDYLTYSLKHIYYFQQPFQTSIPAEHEQSYHDLYVRIIPAGDFGSTTIRSATTDNIIYNATTVWMGTGIQLFPSPEFEIGKPDTIIKPNPEFIDIENHFFNKGDSARADTAWQTAAHLAPLQLLEGGNYGALIYVHYFTLGDSDPTTAEWIIIFYSIPETSSGRWESISGDLPNMHVNSVAPHPFYADSLFIGTDVGAFQTSDGGKHWRQMKFDENSAVKVTQIRAEMHPILDWTVPVLWLGTEEYTMIPEDRLGRIFFSANGGMEWKNTYFPKIAVSAIDIPVDSSLVAFAGAYNFFYNQDGFFASDDTGWVKYDLTPGDTTAIRINDIDVDETNPQRIFLATSNGVFATTNGGKSWTQTDPYHPSTAVAISPFNPKEVYAIQLFGTRSEGIYRSVDDGQTWERRCWTVSAVTLIPDRFVPGAWYWAVKNIGVFKSADDCSTHVEISEGLREKDILCLAQDRRNPKVLYAGTTNGIFRYEEVPTKIRQAKKDEKQFMPQDFKLYPAYPNPFNASMVIRFELSKNCPVKLQIYNVYGQLIRTLVDENIIAGFHHVDWDGKSDDGYSIASGIYFCRLIIERGGDVASNKIVFIK
jgi:hypothetical protein